MKEGQVSLDKVFPPRVVRRIRVVRRALREAAAQGPTEYPYPASFPGAGGVGDEGGAGILGESAGLGAARVSATHLRDPRSVYLGAPIWGAGLVFVPKLTDLRRKPNMSTYA